MVVLLALPYVSSACASTAESKHDVGSQTEIVLSNTVLSPMAYARFCLVYRADCGPSLPLAFHHLFKANAYQYASLRQVNETVNKAITYKYAFKNVVDERWRLYPKRGACADYAVTKRHELLNRGWPKRALLLAEVSVRGGEHHLVVVASSERGEEVLDSLTHEIKTPRQTGYVWIRMQAPENPAVWRRVGAVPAVKLETSPSM